MKYRYKNTRVEKWGCGAKNPRVGRFFDTTSQPLGSRLMMFGVGHEPLTAGLALGAVGGCIKITFPLLNLKKN